MYFFINASVDAVVVNGADLVGADFELARPGVEAAVAEVTPVTADFEGAVLELARPGITELVMAE